MNSRLFLLIHLVSYVSCTLKEEDISQIMIRNGMDVSIDVSLYPKKKYLNEDGIQYIVQDVGAYAPTKFSLSSSQNAILFTYSNSDIKPYMMVTNVFDSIIISFKDKNESLRFTHNDVTGYSENLFSDNSNWNSEIIKACKPPNFINKCSKGNIHYFDISEDKMRIE